MFRTKVLQLSSPPSAFLLLEGLAHTMNSRGSYHRVKDGYLLVVMCYCPLLNFYFSEMFDLNLLNI
jgi:hypothetical protein